jgi:hypothetical protein
MYLSMRRTIGKRVVLGIVAALSSARFAEAIGFPSLPDAIWVRSVSTSAIDFAESLATDEMGNVYYTGTTFGQLAEPSAGGYDGFLTKYDPNGNRLWIHQFGGSSQDSSTGIDVSANGEVVVAGTAGGDFGGPSLGSSDGFVRKYDSNGAVQWTTRIGSSLLDKIIGVDQTDSGEVFVAGYSSIILPHGGNGIVAKLTPQGAVDWTRTITASAPPLAISVAVDSFGAAIVVGQSETGVMLDGSSEAGGAFAIKYDANGNVAWMHQFGDATDIGFDVAVDLLGNAYIVGKNSVRKLAPDGSFLWSRFLRSGNWLSEVSLDGLGHVFVAGNGLTSVPFYGVFGEDGTEIGIHSLPYESGYHPNIAPDGKGNLYFAQTFQASNSFDTALWKVKTVPEPSSFVAVGFVAASCSGCGRKRRC